MTRTAPKTKSKKSLLATLRLLVLPKLSYQKLIIFFIIIVAASGFITVQNSRAATCNVSTILVNSCRPWLGAVARRYPNTVDTIRDQMLAHETRIGRQVDIVHTYSTPGSNLGPDMIYFAQRANTYLFANYKPATTFDAAAGGDATVNSQIDIMADSVKALGAKKLFMTIWHEPQNDVTRTAATPCAVATASAGSPASYRAMWQNVHNRFAARGVTNVVWVMDYQGYVPLDCVINDLYPGDNLVDWVMFNGYGNTLQNDFIHNVQHYYDFFAANSTTGRNYMSKPWGIVEWNIHDSSVADGVKYYTDAKTALDNNIFPRLKAYMIFDSIGPDGNENRVAYDNLHVYSQARQDAYNRFANDPILTGSAVVTPPPTPTPTPTPSPTPTPTPSPTLTIPGIGSSLVKLIGDILHFTPVKQIQTSAPTPTIPGIRSSLVKLIGDILHFTPVKQIQTRVPLIGDTNDDNKVDSVDLNRIITTWGTNDTATDLNHDGNVNAIDLSIALSHWTR